MLAAPAPLLVLGGPTAMGKTGLAIDLAEGLLARGIPAEIVSADSRQVYRGLDIGTAKATPDERARVVHHGIDLVDPDEPFTVADFRAHALDAFAHLPEGIAHLAGRSREGKLVHVAGAPTLVGELVRVRVEHGGPYALRGTLA